MFKGVINLNENRQDRELRVVNAEEVRRKLGDINKSWAQRQYQSWANKAATRNLGPEIVQLSLEKHSRNDYQMSNSMYR